MSRLVAWPQYSGICPLRLMSTCLFANFSGCTGLRDSLLSKLQLIQLTYMTITWNQSWLTRIEIFDTLFDEVLSGEPPFNGMCALRLTNTCLFANCSGCMRLRIVCSENCQPIRFACMTDIYNQSWRIRIEIINISFDEVFNSGHVNAYSMNAG